MAGLGLSLAEQPSSESAEASLASRAGKRVEGLPVFRLEDLKKQGDRVFVAYRDGVYDVTEFIEGHPGGSSKIMLAAGSRVDPFWRIHQQHEGQEHVLELLEQYRVGNLHPDDHVEPSDEADVYVMDPERSSALVVRSAKPFNGETPEEALNTWITPNELFYTRNHFPVPHVDVDQYELEVALPDGRVHRLTLDELKERYQHHEVVATVQCAGNRRNELSAVKPLRGGKWDSGAISTAAWKGVYLRDVLADLGYTRPSQAVQHVHFVGLDHDDEKAYGASIPAEIAFSPERDVLLAFEMNGQDIPRDHGYPLRALAPGVVGARNVKWLGRIELAQHESEAHWQQKDYRGFPPNVDWDNVDWPR